MFDERQEELERICKENPVDIPIPVAAKWLGIAPESLRYHECRVSNQAQILSRLRRVY